MTVIMPLIDSLRPNVVIHIIGSLLDIVNIIKGDSLLGLVTIVY